MTVLQKIILSISILFFFGSLVYLAYGDEKRMKKYNILIYQDRHRYRTDKVDTITNGIKFIDSEGKNVYINGKYIIEKR